MRYLKKPLSEDDLDTMRVNLSTYSKKLNSEPSCDFCGDPKPVFVYAAERMSTGEWITNWRWCACLDCTTAIDKGDWIHVEKKIVAWSHKKFPSVPRKVLETVAEVVLADFFNYIERID